MAEKINQQPTDEQIADLQDSVESLSQEVQVLRDILDEIREDFSWALRNGHSEPEDKPQYSILKKMALDPCAEDWQERLEIVNGTEAEKEVSNEPDQPTATETSDEIAETKEDIQNEIEPEELKKEPTEQQPAALLAENLQERIKEHEEWAETIRDPATEKSEGLRTLRTKNGWATAEYEIAPLPDDRWAIRISLAYHCGDHQGSATPWIDFDSREECLKNFLEHTKRFFSSEIDNGGNDTQRTARIEMLKHFEETLFGFEEPEAIKEKEGFGDEYAFDSIENHQSLPLNHRILEYLSANVGAVNLSDICSDMGFPENNSDDPLANPVNRALVTLQNAGNVTVIETDFGEPEFLFQKPLYLRPDRQTNFNGIPFYEWAEAEEDRDTLTVDRVGDNGDGGEHRFTVKRGDTVEAFFSKDKQEIGKVVGISHANREVRVSFRAITNGRASEGTWFAIGSIYPALEPSSDEEFPTVPLSDVIEQVNYKNTPQEKEWGEADRVASSNIDPTDVPLRDSPGRGMESLTEHHQLYTLDDFSVFLQQLNSNNLAVPQLKASFLHLNSSRGALIHDLVAYKNAKELRMLAYKFGCLDAKRNTKQQNAESIVRSMMLTYTLNNSVTYQPFSGESYEDAIIKVVESITDEQIQNQIKEQQEKAAEIEKSLTNPETFQEFRQFVQSKGESELSHRQLIQYDKLRAKQTRLQRANKKTATVRVEKFNGDIAGLEITIKEGYHTRQEIPLWICQLSERIDRATFTDLKMKAKQLGGWWSSFKKADAGFQFKNEDSAQKFQSLLQGNADRSDELANRKTHKIETASERLQQLADDLEQSANESLHQDRQTNTVRRSEMAAGIRGRAYVDIAFAGTMRSLAKDLASGEAIYLDGIRTKTQLQTLIDILRRAKRTHNEKLLKEKLLKEKGELGVWERHRAVEDLSNRPMSLEDTDFAGYPFPSIYKCNLDDVIHKALHRKGVMQRAKKMQKQIAREPDFIQFKEEYEIKQFADFCTRCKDAGIDVQWLESSLDDYKRLHAANIHTLPELRMALRELVPHLQSKREDDPVLKAEQALVGKQLDGFFPTPKPIISRMLELADIQIGDRILEPSAGKGDILDMIRLHHPENEVTSIERNGTLFDVLEAKGHAVEQGDFLEHQGSYDRILMNPPFEKGMEMAHVLHAFDLLAPNGRLIAIMSEGPFFRSDNQATQFRDWLDEFGGESEQLPVDAFNNTETFRKTGVQTRIVTLTK